MENLNVSDYLVMLELIHDFDIKQIDYIVDGTLIEMLICTFL